MKVKTLTQEEVTTINQIKKEYGEELRVLTEDYRESKATIKTLPKRTPEEKIIDMFIEGESIDTIKKELNSDYHQVEKVLINCGIL